MLVSGVSILGYLIGLAVILECEGASPGDIRAGHQGLFDFSFVDAVNPQQRLLVFETERNRKFPIKKSNCRDSA